MHLYLRSLSDSRADFHVIALADETIEASESAFTVVATGDKRKLQALC